MWKSSVCLDVISAKTKLTSSVKTTTTPTVQMGSVHIKVDEKITLKAGRDGGLQNMEVRGIIFLRISDQQYGQIRLAVQNNDDKGFQLQVLSSLLALKCYMWL